MLSDILGGDLDFEALFDEFETLMALASTDAGFTWVGRFAWRNAMDRDTPPYIAQLAEEITTPGAAHPLLAAGFFGSDFPRANMALKAVQDRALQLAHR
jgi:hypothetical protein